MKPDGTAANVIFEVAPGSLTALDHTVKDIRADAAPPPGIRATPSGLAVVGTGLLDNLESNRILLTYLAMAFVFAFLAVRLRSVVRALLSLVPVAIAVGTASLVAYAAGFNLSPMTAVGGPLVIAACTEFTSLILLRFVEERGHGLDPQRAVDVAASRTGRAFIVSALTAIAGVAVLSFSTLPLLRDFGRIVAMNVTVALLSALVILPPLLVWADRRNLVSRGLIKPKEPFLETPPRPTLARAD
jgi:predicted RND superfamily exporter protein